MTCDYDGCEEPNVLRAYASYNADHGENAHPLHARYPGPMIRACANHVGRLMVHDADSPTSSLQWLVVHTAGIRLVEPARKPDRKMTNTEVDAAARYREARGR